MKIKKYITHLLLIATTLVYSQNYQPYQQTYSLHDFTSTPVAGNGATPNFNLQIQNNLIILSFNSGQDYYFNTTTLKTGPIKQIFTTDALPNVVLGKLKLASGVETSYQVSVQNNWIVVSSNTNESIGSIQGLNSLVVGIGTSTGAVSSVFNPGNENYVRTIEAQTPLQGSIKYFNEGVHQKLTYYDGLGKAKQNNNIGFSTTKKDIITHLEYDVKGNQTKEYLPYTSTQNNGAYVSNAQDAVTSYYNTSEYESTLNPYSEKILDQSPLNQILEIAAPGTPWKYDNNQVGQITTTKDYQKWFDNTPLSTPVINQPTWPDYTQTWLSTQFTNNSTSVLGSLILVVNNGNTISVKLSLSNTFVGSDFKVGYIGNINGISLPDMYLGLISYTNGDGAGKYLKISNNQLIIESAYTNDRPGIGFDYVYSKNIIPVEANATLITTPIKYTTRTSSNNTIKVEYGINSENEVRNYQVNYINGDKLTPQLLQKGAYQKNELSKTITKTENWQPTQINIKDNTTEEFTDKNGRIILKRTYENNQSHDTYYVYDYFGNLVYVLPPKGLDELLSNSAIQYQNTTQDNNYTDFVLFGVGGGGSVTSTINNNALTIQFFAGFSSTLLKEGNVVLLNTTPQLPDMYVGKLNCTKSDGTIADGVYDVSIKAGYIHLKRNYGDFSISGFSATLSASIASQPSENITFLPTDPKLAELCYQYKYDGKNRLVEKKIPGKGWEYIIYDKLNRPVLTQDAILRASNKWLFTKYDVFNRVVYTGEYTNNTALTRIAVQALADASVVQHEKKVSLSSVSTTTNGIKLCYTKNAFPTGAFSLYTINYYDDYDFDTQSIHNTNTYQEPVTTQTKGLSTGGHIRILGTTNWETTVTYYDKKARPIYAGTKNSNLSTFDIIQTKYDFVGKPLKVRSTHKKDTNAEIVTLDTYTYDHAGRLLTQRQCIGTTTLPDTCGDSDPLIQENLILSQPITQSQTSEATKSIKMIPGFLAKASATLTYSAKIITSSASSQGLKSELIVSNTYNALGQLISKKVGNTAAKPLQNVDYKYNIRGWLTQINNPSSIGTDLFAFELKYNTPTLGAVPLYNGNISQSQWRTANTDTSLKNYNYSYDALNRLRNAQFAKIVGATTTFDTQNESLTYDKNGNIQTLNRTGVLNSGVVDPYLDILNYTYSGNQLQNVVDTGHTYEGFDDHLTTGSTQNDYTYDVNGNMTTDRNKNITSISYNHLNLPTQINFGTGTNKITYTYSATGQKQSKAVFNNGVTTITQYAGAYTYEKIGTGAYTLQYIAQPEGYIYKNASGVYQYAYQYKDHLGNIRLSYTDSNKDGVVTPSEIIEENNYYPFGMKHKGYNAVVNSTGNANAQKFKYNGKEYQDELNLNLYDYGARNYDAALGRWMNVDPLAENSRRWTPYNYAYNNPIYFIDPDGMQSVGADGLTNEQWLSARGNSEKEQSYRNENRGNKSNGGGDKNKKKDNDEKKTKKDKEYDNSSLEYAMASSVVLVGDDVSGLGVIDDVLIPIIWVGATANWMWQNKEAIYKSASYATDAINKVFDPSGFYYVTYTKTSKNGNVYVGRTSGYGDPESIVKRRDANHHIKGYGSAILSTFAQATISGGYATRALDPAYWSIRGSEQLQIEAYRNLGISGNSINGISPNNGSISKYLEWGRKLMH